MDGQPRRFPGRYDVWSSIRSSARLFICFLVLASRTHAGGWSSTFVTAPHDGNNLSEVQRIRNQHPGEPECLEDNRVVGFLGPTRCKHLFFSFSCFFYMFLCLDRKFRTQSLITARIFSSRRYVAQIATRLFSTRSSQFSSRVERTAT